MPTTSTSTSTSSTATSTNDQVAVEVSNTHASSASDDGDEVFGLRKTIISLVICLVAIMVGFFVMSTLASMAPQPILVDPPKPVLYVSTYEVSRESIQEILTSFGNVESDREVTLTARVAGEITETYKFEVGKKIFAEDVGPFPEPGPSKKVKADIVLKIDARDYTQRLQIAIDRVKEDTAELNRLTQENNNLARKLKGQLEDYETYKKEYARTLNAYEKGAITKAQLSQAQLELRRYEDAVIQLETEKDLMPTKIELAKSRKVTHENDIEQAKIDIQRTNINPPYTGRISRVFVQKGQYVRPGDQLFTMVDTQNVVVKLPVPLGQFMQLRGQLAEDEIQKVKIGINENQPAIWDGAVERFSPVADARTRTIDVYVEIDNTKQKTPLLPGTYVMTRIMGGIHKDVLVIPREVIVNNHIFVVKEKEQETPEDKESSLAKSSENSELAEPQSTEPAKTKAQVVFVAKKLPIKVIKSIQTIAIVTGEIEPGDRVVTTNLDLISEMLEEQTEFTLKTTKTNKLKDLQKSIKFPLWQLLN